MLLKISNTVHACENNTYEPPIKNSVSVAEGSPSVSNKQRHLLTEDVDTNFATHAKLSGRTRKQHALVLFGMKETLWIPKSDMMILKSSPRFLTGKKRPDGTKKAYVKLPPDYEAFEVANKIEII